MPTGLFDNFDLTMGRIRDLPDPDQTRFAEQTILWVVHSVRHLSVDELCHAITASDGCTEFDEGNLPPPAQFEEYCCGFVMVDTKTNTVRLAHYSIDEYFRQEKKHAFLDHANEIITVSCISYLMAPGAVQDDEPSKDSEETETSKDPRPFLKYAVQHWGDHAAKEFTTKVGRTVNLFLGTDETLLSWYRRDESFTNRLPDRYESRRSPLLPPLPKPSALHVAARFGIRDMVSADPAMFAGNLNRQGMFGDTPLMVAAERGQDDFVRLLLEQEDLRPNIVDVDGHTALCRAILAIKESTVRILVADHRIDVNMCTALARAVEVNNIPIMQELLRRPDSDVNVISKDYFKLGAPLYLAIGELRIDIIEFLLKRDDLCPRFLDQPYRSLKNMLNTLTEDEDIMTTQELERFPKLVKVIAEDFWERGRRNPRDAFLSWLWPWLNKESLVGSHLDYFSQWFGGAYRKVTDEEGMTLLHALMATRIYVSGLAQKTIQQGFDIEAIDGEGRTPLLIAVHGENLEYVRDLLEAGANIHAADEDGWTAMHYAALTENLESAKLLAEAGASATSITNDGWTVLHEAAQRGSDSMVKFLLGKGADVMACDRYRRTPLHAAASSGNLETVEVLLENGSIVDAEDHRKRTPLMMAAGQSNLGIIQVLLRAGANLAAADDFGWTALHEAAQRDQGLILSYLLNDGADPNAMSPVFGTPTTIAVQNMRNCRKELLTRGGDPLICGFTGRNSLDCAAMYGFEDSELQAYRAPGWIPTPEATIRRKLWTNVRSLVQYSITVDYYTAYAILGHGLALLGLVDDAIVSLQRATFKRGNITFHNTKCRCCESKQITGSRFVCTTCLGTELCMACFSQHADFARLILSLFSAEDVFASRGKDERWTWFVDLNVCRELRYKPLELADEASAEEKSEIILTILKEELGESASEGWKSLKEEVPWCSSSHTYIHLPSFEWIGFPKDVVDTKGHSITEWARDLYDRMPADEEATENGEHH